MSEGENVTQEIDDIENKMCLFKIFVNVSLEIVLFTFLVFYLSINLQASFMTIKFENSIGTQI
jgi:hypothetical protein